MILCCLRIGNAYNISPIQASSSFAFHKLSEYKNKSQPLAEPAPVCL